MPITLTKFRSAIRQLTVSTKTLLTFIVTSTSLAQITEVRDFVIKHTVAHPRLTSVGVGVCGVLVVLHNPKVQQFLHIEEETNVDLPDGSSANVHTDTTVTPPSTPQ